MKATLLFFTAMRVLLQERLVVGDTVLQVDWFDYIEYAQFTFEMLREQLDWVREARGHALRAMASDSQSALDARGAQDHHQSAGDRVWVKGRGRLRLHCLRSRSRRSHRSDQRAAPRRTRPGRCGSVY